MKIRHAFTGHIYELTDDGHVKVVDPSTSAEGIFDARGNWKSGELRHADFHMCGAVGGRKAANPMGQMMAAADNQDAASPA